MRIQIQHSYSYFTLFLFLASNIFVVSTDESVMLDDKQKKVSFHTLIIVVASAIVILGSSYSSLHSVSAFPFQSAIHHHKVFDKKQVSGSSSSSDAKANSNNNNKNNNQDTGTNDGGDTSPDNNLQSAETDQQQQQQQKQGGGENVAPIDTSTPTPTPETTCEQGSNCTDQQGFSDRDRSSTTSSAGTSGQDNNTPFVLPFP